MSRARALVRNLVDFHIDTKVSKTRVKQAKKQLKLLHEDDDGYITIAVKKGRDWSQYHYKYEELKEHIEKILGLNIDTYMSINSFYIPVRRAEYIRHINSLYVEFDNHDVKKLTKHDIESIFFFLEEDYFDRLVPYPSMSIITGRGIQLYWFLENLPKQGITLWALVQQEMINTFKDFDVRGVSVDEKCIDVTRVFRVAASMNTKSNILAKIYSSSDKKYRLDEIIEGYFPHLQIDEKKKVKKVKTQKERKIKKLYNSYSLHYARLQDLVKLVDVRNGYCRVNGELVEEGQRELMCFLYRYWSCLYVRDTAAALENTLHFNSQFKKPLPEKEVIKQTKSAEKTFDEWMKDPMKGYNYSNERLIQLLEITEKEQRHLSTIIGIKEKYRRKNQKRRDERRNENGLTKREQEHLNRKNKINELYKKGLNPTEIAKKLGINRSTVYRNLNK